MYFIKNLFIKRINITSFCTAHVQQENSADTEAIAIKNIFIFLNQNRKTEIKFL